MPPCRFTYVECGAEGRVFDGDAFRNSDLYTVIENGAINFPQPRTPPQGKDVLPYVLVGDEAFSLKNYLMRLYSGDQLPPDEEVSIIVVIIGYNLRIELL